MANIWDFLLQTVSVSLVAVLLLIIKRIFKDKLSPRWQYGVWVILALRILLPVQASRYVLLPFGIYLEMIKSTVENGMSSAYTSAYTPAQPSHAFPVIQSAPQSITDILFVIYFAGVAVFLLYYFITYIRLRLALRKGIAVTDEMNQTACKLLTDNKIRFCRVIYAEGISSAFICGIIRPVLVLPLGKTTDQKVLMHELMHLKHLDSLQSVFWCLLRCLHWCNPFMHYVFNVIGNDMESLCDQRVLEKLEGEERREYGILLLNEVNKKYARMPGTTSVSNGGKNISKRIEAIVRFKKYPTGMSLVSVCIAIILAVPCLFVSAGISEDYSVYFPKTNYEFQKAVVYSRLNRCTTVAGAIDTYAKALMDSNGIMLLTASPTEKQEEILKELKELYKIEGGFTSVIPEGGRPFTVFNLIKTDTDKYSAVLIFSTDEEDENEAAGEEYHTYGDTLLVPIEIFKENNNWVVKETGKRKKSKNYLSDRVTEQPFYLGDDSPILYEKKQKGKNGSLTVKVTTVFQTDYSVIESENVSFFTDGIGYDREIHLDADFSGCLVETNYIYNYEGEDYSKVEHVAMEYTADLDAEFVPEKTYLFKDSSSGSTNGSGKRNYTVNDGEKWDRTVQNSDINSNFYPKDLMEGYETMRKIAVYIDGTLTDVFTVEVKING